MEWLSVVELFQVLNTSGVDEQELVPIFKDITNNIRAAQTIFDDLHSGIIKKITIYLMIAINKVLRIFTKSKLREINNCKWLDIIKPMWTR